MQTALGKALATLFLVKMVATHWFDMMNSTEKIRLTKILEQKGTQLLVIHRPTG
jgi:hypothetical protein